jgi:hypothetical protein
MNTTILRETRKITIDNINKKYITRAELNSYINPPKPTDTKNNKNILSPNKANRIYVNKRETKKKTIKTYEADFNKWYNENKYEIDLVFGSMLGIYTSKKVVFYHSRNELYTLFVQKYYRKVNKRIL